MNSFDLYFLCNYSKLQMIFQYGAKEKAEKFGSFAAASLLLIFVFPHILNIFCKGLSAEVVRQRDNVSVSRCDQ